MISYTNTRRDGYVQKDTSGRRKNKEGERRNFSWVWKGRAWFIALMDAVPIINPYVAKNGYLGGRGAATKIVEVMREETSEFYNYCASCSRAKTFAAVVSKVRGRMQKNTDCNSTNNEHYENWRNRPWGAATVDEMKEAARLLECIKVALSSQPPAH